MYVVQPIRYAVVLALFPNTVLYVCTCTCTYVNPATCIVYVYLYMYVHLYVNPATCIVYMYCTCACLDLSKLPALIDNSDDRLRQ